MCRRGLGAATPPGTPGEEERAPWGRGMRGKRRGRHPECVPPGGGVDWRVNNVPPRRSGRRAPGGVAARTRRTEALGALPVRTLHSKRNIREEAGPVGTEPTPPALLTTSTSARAASARPRASSSTTPPSACCSSGPTSRPRCVQVGCEQTRGGLRRRRLSVPYPRLRAERSPPERSACSS
jgi:hypothetical protein